jgi:hypothetical protein
VTCIEGKLPWQRVSVDGITSDVETIVEAKLMKRDAFEELRDHGIVPAGVRAAAAHQIETAGTEALPLRRQERRWPRRLHVFVDLTHPAPRPEHHRARQRLLEAGRGRRCAGA